MRIFKRFTQLILTVTTLLGIFASSTAFAVTAGRLDAQPVLGEELNGTFQLSGVGALVQEQIIVSLADNEVYEQMGLQRPDSSLGIRFNVGEVDEERDVSVIKVSSQEPVTEPSLSLVIRISWPQGTIIKSYTLLLDLPS